MRWIAALTVAFAAVAAVDTAHAGKPPATWSCSVQFRDAANDIVKSDGGTYVNGVSGVSCSIDGSNGWLYLTFASAGKKSPARSLVVVGQTGSVRSYSTITSGTELDIKFLRDAVAPYDVLPWRLRVSNNAQFLQNFGQFTGGSSYDEGPALAGTSSAYITTVDACTWTATMYTTGLGLQTLSHGENATTQTSPRVALLTEAGVPGEEANGVVDSGYFTMPFQATIHVIGGKAGCAP